MPLSCPPGVSTSPLLLLLKGEGVTFVSVCFGRRKMNISPSAPFSSFSWELDACRHQKFLWGSVPLGEGLPYSLPQRGGQICLILALSINKTPRPHSLISPSSVVTFLAFIYLILLYNGLQENQSEIFLLVLLRQLQRSLNWPASVS